MLFTDVGPYAYPLDLFCRGVEAVAGWKNSVSARAFFANRIDGYDARIREAEYNRLIFNDPEDRDMIGASLEGSVKSTRLGYMYRHDRGAERRIWWSDIDSMYMSGYETRSSHGILLEHVHRDRLRITGQYLTGSTRLHAADYYYVVMEEDPWDRESGWEEGYRALAEVSWTQGAITALAGWKRTTLERNADHLSTYTWKEARMDIYDAGLGYATGRLKMDFEADFIEFNGDGGTGRNFWLQSSNFWLDGDMVRTELLQFLDSRRMWRLSLKIEEGGVEDIPGPYRLEGYVLAKTNLDNDASRSIFEISGGKGIRAGSWLSLHTDLRYVSYTDDRWVGESSFFNLWAGLRGHLGGSGWAAIGIGVAPHRFDRWYYDFTGDGRESYLLDEGLFNIVNRYFEEGLLEELGRREEELSEEWSFTFEGGFSF
jgi:hypothetical protein